MPRPITRAAACAAAACTAIVASPAAALAATPHTLREGAHGAAVHTLQAELSRVGIAATADGEYGPQTARAVRRFERREHLPADGVASARVQRDLAAALRGRRVGAAAGRGHTLREGMRGAAVRALQRRLTAAGYRTAADGDFGPATTASVERFQRANGLRATGVVSPAEMKLLTGSVNTATTDEPGGAGGSGGSATINADGTLTLPAGAPTAVQQIVAAANQIVDTHYVWGGGHGSFTSPGYDCSGAVSYALHGADLLSSPEDSSGLESFGARGRGSWVTIYADAGHAWLVVDGRAFDTADYGGPNIPAGSGPRWRRSPTGNLAGASDWAVRHPVGL